MCTVKFIHSFIHESLQDFLVLRSQKLKTAKNQGNSATFRRVCKFTRVSTGNLIYRQTSPRKPFPTIAISPIQFPHAKKKKHSFRKGSQQNQAFFAATSPVRTDFLLAADWQTITSWWTHFWCTIYSIRYDIYATSPTPTSPNFPGFSALYLSFRENL